MSLSTVESPLLAAAARGAHVTDFGALPPEINSAKLYAGPGSGPLLAAAAAWDRLADELYFTAASYGSTVSSLTGEGWLGPASASMTTAVTTYLRWITGTAGMCEQTATRARAAAVAYEAAVSRAVPPSVIAANRSQFLSLIPTNTLGQNTPAIAAIEGRYGEMWAQDATALYGYANESAIASRLTTFRPLPITAGPASQTAGSAQAAGASMLGTLSQLTAALPEALHALATRTASPSRLSRLLRGNGARAMSRFVPLNEFVPPPARPDTDANAGRAISLGALSVPQTWVNAARAAR
jgi:PPE-repeat protein